MANSAASGNINLNVLITGGAGYVSSVLLETIERLQLSRSLKIILLDKTMISEIPQAAATEVVTHESDLTDYPAMSVAFEGVDAVLHLASYGMSGKEQLHKDTIWAVNVVGTENVIKACQEYNVKALVFTSTVNVVYGGQRIEDGDESLPYFDASQRSWDNYGNSKMAAEKAILKANGSLGKDGKTVLRTCALRLPGIYGPKERRHLPRVVGLMKQGLFKVTYGDNPTVEFIHVSNVCQAMRLTLNDLLKDKSVAAGQAYFISDGQPINNFEFFRPLTDALGIPFPKIVLPMWPVFFVATLIEFVYGLVHRWLDFQPLLCRAEVYKTAQTHYFSIEKARKELGYEPEYQNDMTEIAEHYRLQASQPDPSLAPRSMVGQLLINIVLVIAIFSVIMSFLPMAQ